MTSNLRKTQLDHVLQLRGAEAAAQLSVIGGASGLAHALATSEVTGILGTKEDIERRKRAYGNNKLATYRPVSFFHLLVNAMQDTAILILEIAALASTVIELFYTKISQDDRARARSVGSDEIFHGWLHWTAVVVGILVLVFGMTFVDFFHEYLLASVNRLVRENLQIDVVRRGQKISVPAGHVVVGDLCLLKAGDVIPADGIVVSSRDLKVDESPVSGRSGYVEKSESDPILSTGTVVVEGSAQMIVTAVGRLEEQINLKRLNEKSYYWMSAYEPMAQTARNYSNLQKKLLKLSLFVSSIGAQIAFLMFAMLVMQRLINAFIIQERSWDTGDTLFIIDCGATCLAVLMIAVPESLPLVAASSLVFSLKGMVGDKILLRHPDACEMMGNVTVLCTDKTGTLTTNKMRVVRSYICDVMYTRTPHFTSIPDPIGDIITHAISLNSMYSSRLLPPEKYGEPPVFEGDHRECALLLFVYELGRSYQAIRDAYPLNELRKIFHFNSERKYMMTAARRTTGGYRVFVKGAPESVVPRCQYYCTQGGKLVTFTPITQRRFMEDVVDSMTDEGLHTIALAYRDFVFEDAKINQTLVIDEPTWDEDYTYDEFTLIAIIGIEDPVRSEVPKAIAMCQQAGISVIVMTGDNVKTATYIAKKCGLLKEGDTVVEANDFDRSIRDASGKMQQSLLDEAWSNIRVVARCSPADKFHLVKGITNSWSASGSQTVAAVGESLGDEPALRQSDVTFSRGIKSSAAVREMADGVALDDNFATVARSLKWGSNLTDNVSRFLQFQITAGIVTLIFLFFACCALEASPLKILQLVWINFVIDILGFVSLSRERPDPKLPLNYRHPGRPTHPLISRIMVKNIGGQVVYQLTVLFYLLFQGDLLMEVHSGIFCKYRTQHVTSVFNTLVLMTLFNMFNARKIHGERNIFSGIHRNCVFCFIWIFSIISQMMIIHYGTTVFWTSQFELMQWTWCMAFGVGTLIWAQLINFLPTKYVVPAFFGFYREQSSTMADKDWKSISRIFCCRSIRRIKTQTQLLMGDQEEKITRDALLDVRRSTKI